MTMYRIDLKTRRPIVGDLTPSIRNRVNGHSARHETGGADEINLANLLGLTAEYVEVSELSTATYDDVQDYINFFGDRTLLSGGAISDAGSGVATIASLTGWCKETDSDTAVGKFFNYAGANTSALTDLTTHYIYCDYNGGTPQLVTATDKTTHGFKLDHILVGTVFNNSNTLHFHKVDNIGIGRVSRTDMHHREETTAHRASGLVTSDGGSLALSITSGVFYEGISRHASTVNGSTWSYWYTSDSGSNWTEDTSQTALVQSYNNIASGKVSLGTGKYGVHWVYSDLDGAHLHIVYGQGNYNANQAEEADVPSVLPPIVTGYGLLIAKIISHEGTTDLIITYPWTSAFKSNLATDHGSLGGLGDDDHTQYILHSLADAANDFLVASGANTYVKKTLAETLALISPLTTRGDMMFMNATVNTRLAKGADNTIMAMGANDPEWKTPATVLSDIGAQPLDATLTSIALLGTGADKIAYTTNTDVWAEAAITAAGRSMVGAANAAAQLALMTTAIKAELDLLDLAALTAGELLVATGAASAAWQSTGVKLSAPDISGSVTAASALTLPAHSLSGAINAAGYSITGIGIGGAVFNYSDTVHLSNTTDAQNIIFKGGTAAGYGAELLFAGTTYGAPGVAVFLTANTALNAHVERLRIGIGNEATITFASSVITGMKLGGSLNANGQSIASAVLAGTGLITVSRSDLVGISCVTDAQSLIIAGGTDRVGANIFLAGSTYGAPGVMIFQTPNTAVNAGVERLRMNIGDSATMVWAACTHSGLDITTGQTLKVAGTSVVGARVVDARCDDAINSGDATTDGVIDSLRDAMITHGLIAAA